MSIDIKTILEKHSKWLNNEEGGKRADLSEANLSRADLSGANLSGANLYRADLSEANLYRANLSDAIGLSGRSIAPESGQFIVYKKLKDNLIAKLLVLKSAKRVGGLTERKCRVEKAKVLSITTIDGESKQSGFDKYSGQLKYRVGKIVKPDAFNDDIRKVCTNGIHCFITRQEAIDYY